ncbi:TKL protein kinase, partial [Phytophthora palmivora]
MHLQIDALLGEETIETQKWQNFWQEDYKEQIQVFKEFLEQSKVQSELKKFQESERLELLTALQYERMKLSEAEKEDILPVEERELLDRAVFQVSRAVAVENVKVPNWFVPFYEVQVRETEKCKLRVEGEWNGMQVTLEFLDELEMVGLETLFFRTAEKWFGVTNPYIVTYTKNVKNIRNSTCVVVGSDGKAKIKASTRKLEKKCDASSEPSMEDDVYAFVMIIQEIIGPLDIDDPVNCLSRVEEDEEHHNGVNNAVRERIREMMSSKPSERPDMSSV